MAVVDANYGLQALIGLQVPNRERHLATICMEASSKRVLVMCFCSASCECRDKWKGQGGPKALSGKNANEIQVTRFDTRMHVNQHYFPFKK